VVLLDVLYYVDLVEYDAGIKNVEGRIIEGSCENDVFKELEAICVMYFALDSYVTKRDRLMELRRLMEELAVISFVRREIRVVYKFYEEKNGTGVKKTNIQASQRHQRKCRPQECVHTYHDHSSSLPTSTVSPDCDREVSDVRIVCIRLHNACRFSRLSKSSAVFMTSINDLM
jgi:hypothetical protein